MDHSNKSEPTRVCTMKTLPDFNKETISKLQISVSVKSLQALMLQLAPLLGLIHSRPLLQISLVPEEPIEEIQSIAAYESVALGGTFDYFHLGHQILLLQALVVAKKEILVGVSGPALLYNKKFKQCLQPITTRMQSVREYINLVRPDLRVNVTEINDPYGPAIVLPQLDAIVVTAETIKGGQKINDLRSQKSLSTLKIVVAPILTEDSNEDTQINNKLSSSGIRAHILEKNQMTQAQFQEYQLFWWQMVSELAGFLKAPFPSPQFSKRGDHWWKIVLLKYSEYWRFYHTNHHIYDILHLLALKFPQSSSLQLLISIWFHDVEYQPLSPLNQEKSAELAQQFIEQLAEGYPVSQAQVAGLINRVKYNILATKKHSPEEENQTTKVLIDLDMGILNEEEIKYKQYASNIRKEYQPWVGPIFGVKRKEFLESLDLQHVFFFEKDISNLKNNVKLEIESLTNKIEE